MINYNRLGYEIKRDLFNFSEKISKGLKRPKKKFVHQMLYGILTGNKVHLSEIARSLKEDSTLKKIIDRLSRNLHVFECQSTLWNNYLALVKKQAKEDYAVIVIDRQIGEVRDAVCAAVNRLCLLFTVLRVGDCEQTLRHKCS